MSHASELIEKDIIAYLDAHQNKTLLRFITCGSVDDGKSTLIGRLLFESHLVYEDQMAALKSDSAKVGTTGDELDMALLVDGLAAEREQGITIDVAYRFFSTEKRKFIVADTPGHEQYTRNMATGASNADLAVILIDARRGLLEQTRRHSFICSLLGIGHVVLAVNKLDLVDFSQATFDEIVRDYMELAKSFDFKNVVAIPMSALKGDNVVQRSGSTPWYDGPTLLEHLETVDVQDVLNEAPFRLPVQVVTRPSHDFRGFAGTIVSGTIRAGDEVRISPSGRTSTVDRIVTFDGDLTEAVANQALTITLADEVDVSRGDVICEVNALIEVSDHFDAQLVWMHEQPLIAGRPYLFKLGGVVVGATVTKIKHKVNVNNFDHLAASRLDLNEVGEVTISVDKPVPFDPYPANRDTGGFILIDRASGSTLAAGMLRFALRRADNIHWQALEIDKAARAELNGHSSAVVWLTGLSGAGKSTIADALSKRLHALGCRSYVLDGDNVRHGLCQDLGFTEPDRVENMRRVGEVAHLMADAGLIVVTSFISPFHEERQRIRERVDTTFVEVFVDAPLEVAEDRDVKGLYAKARRGELKNLTGIDSPYEKPSHPEVRVDAVNTSVAQAVDAILARLIELRVLPE